MRLHPKLIDLLVTEVFAPATVDPTYRTAFVSASTTSKVVLTFGL